MSSPHHPSFGRKAIPVTADNFPRAETDMYLARVVQENGGFGKFFHYRQPMPIEKQDVVRANRDTLYSAAVFDLDAAPVTITMPDAADRFMSLIVIDEDEYVPGVFYGAGKHTFTKADIGTRYAHIGIRTLVDPDNPGDIEAVHRLQDAIEVTQTSHGRFEIPNWDKESQKKVRDALIALSATLPDMRHAFGARDQVDPVRHLIASASAWGGNPDKDALYLNVTPALNNGQTAHWLHAQDVPVDGFWSITVYDQNGYIPPNDRKVYSFNNLTAKTDDDGAVTIQFGGDPVRAKNCIPIVPGWNYMVRLYRPRAEILNGTWRFPEAQPVH